MNSNLLTSVPNLKIFRDNHVHQDFNKSYHKRKSKKLKRNPSTTNQSVNSAPTPAANPNPNESMVRDLALDRSASDLNLHSSNALRNSFIIEEDEAADEPPLLPPTAAAANTRPETAFELPFAELVYLNLADNQIEEEDDLISLVSWPMLNEIIIYGNPIVYNNVGLPPLLKQYLVDRLGVNLQRTRPLRALKTPLLLPQREHRIVEETVPKIPKMPVELRMLTYYQDEAGSSSGRRLDSGQASLDERSIKVIFIPKLMLGSLCRKNNAEEAGKNSFGLYKRNIETQAFIAINEPLTLYPKITDNLKQ